jgi:hypothetical protein
MDHNYSLHGDVISWIITLAKRSRLQDVMVAVRRPAVWRNVQLSVCVHTVSLWSSFSSQNNQQNIS